MPNPVQATPELLPLLLSQDEGPTLEFKSEWYRIEPKSKGRVIQRDELIKDVLALANGNAESAGKPSVLIIGASDKRNEDGSRTLFDVGEVTPSPSEILQLVRSASNPPLDSLDVVPFFVEGKRLFALAIPPSIHLFETTRPIQTQKRVYSERVVFIRRSDAVDIASAGERDAIRRLKEIRLSEATNPPPMAFGLAVGATATAILYARIAGRLTRRTEGAIAGAAVGAVFGSLFGLLMAASYASLLQLTKGWKRLPPDRRGLAIAGATISAAGLWYLSDKSTDALLARMGLLKRKPEEQPPAA